MFTVHSIQENERNIDLGVCFRDGFQYHLEVGSSEMGTKFQTGEHALPFNGLEMLIAHVLRGVSWAWFTL